MEMAEPADIKVFCFYISNAVYTTNDRKRAAMCATCCLRAFRCKCVMLNKHVSCVLFFFWFFLQCFIIFRRGGYWSGQTRAECVHIYSLYLYTYCIYLCVLGRHVRKGEKKAREKMLCTLLAGLAGLAGLHHRWVAWPNQAIPLLYHSGTPKRASSEREREKGSI